MKTFLFTTTTLCFFIFSANAMSEKPKEEKKYSAKIKKQPKLSGKSLGYFQMDITESSDNDDHVLLIARVVPRKEMTGTTYQWKIPNHVKVLAGATKGMTSLEKGMEKSFELNLLRETLKEGDQIFFIVFKTINGERHGGSKSYIYSTKDIKKGSFQKSHKKKIKYHE